ncbi:type II secretion system F family protein [Terrihalobacillus insolitus]|uniref:type II secretion system F family protein n=1 Tax=Terrihalobacillus insolitus TaxID=2950438 RepID=UPI00234255DF|nr:type II secretion system F family protein [Terrihalobacillus insolitus]MDC3413859.1 type II secretion system F family protein [Terrihalobacillus insolitus]
MNYTFLFLFFITFATCTVLAKLMLSFILEKGKYEKRLEKYVVVAQNKGNVDKKHKSKDHSTLKKASKALESVMNFSKYDLLLTQSGVALSQGELFIGRIMTAVICMTISYLYGVSFLLTAGFGVIGFYLPIMYVKRKRKKRLQRCSEQLGEALGTMANALRAGFSFMQAMKMVAKEIGDPLGSEFIKALQEINYGVTVEDAFKSLLERLPDRELEIVLNTLIIQRSSGGNLAYLLETMQETIIGRSRVKDEVKTLTSQGKLSSVVITILPVALALYIKLINPEYFNMLFSHPLGWAMVIFGTINIILGWFFIKKIVHIEV